MLTEIQKQIIADIRAYIQSTSIGEGSGHDWWHIYRVEKMALAIASEEKADIFIVRLAALLHDMDDWKFNQEGSKNAESLLIKSGLDKKSIEMILHIIQQVSYTGAGENPLPDSLEACVVQDADRLDAIGAIGIARAFAYGGSKNREMYNPEIKPVMHESFQEYKNSQSHTINHFYEKLLLLKDRLHTPAAKQLAIKRHHFMEMFLEEFFEEWGGE